MAVKKHYQIKIVDTEAEEGQNLRKSFMLYESEVDSVGGIGNFVESIDKTLSRDDRLEIIPVYQDD